MDSAAIINQLKRILKSTLGTDLQCPFSPLLPATNVKYFGRQTNLLPQTPLLQAKTFQTIHLLCSPFPYLTTTEGLSQFCNTAQKLLRPSPSWFIDQISIVDYLMVSVGICTNLFIKPPLKHNNLKSYLSFLRKQDLFSALLADFAPLISDQKQFAVKFGTGGRYRIEYVLKTADLINQIVTVKGWAKTVRVQGGGSFAFIELNDGSTIKNLQIIVDKGIPDFQRLKGTGISLSCTGLLVESPGSNQPIQLKIEDPEKHQLIIIGDCDQKAYPFAKKKHTMEFIRSQGHLRSRTNTIGSVARVRSALAFATHQFFNSRGFLYIHTPIITASDCEGAGEMFEVCYTDPNKEIKQQTDFFGRKAFLTVSGQLDVENYCCGLSDVYTFGPTFRAENSHTSRHLSEFWMIEPQIAFGGLEQNMECAQSYLKYCVKYALSNCLDDLLFFDAQIEKGLVQRLQKILDGPFARMTYTEAVDCIRSADKKFKQKLPDWGDDLKAEHERYVCEEVVNGPVIVYNYPKILKAFYMKVNDDDQTVQAMDILIPRIGEVVGGSVREDRLEVLDQMIEFKGLEKDMYWWYRDLRRFGTVPHAGFGLGFERLVMMVTGVENIRDVIPYPRWPGHAEF